MYIFICIHFFLVNEIIFDQFKSSLNNKNNNTSRSTQQQQQSDNSDNEPFGILIPENLSLTQEIVYEQIKIIRHLFPQHFIDIYEKVKKQKKIDNVEVSFIYILFYKTKLNA